tara:strand:+ start:541 stop:948 length:408 start_codon:yes stop_codon:yes gene_type:complete
MVNWENSYKYGEKKEEALLPILQEYFGKDIERSKGGRFAKYDYTDEKVNYELKSRTNKIKQYPTTMITRNKVEGNDANKDLILLFNYTDCLAYIEYEAEQFKQYTTESFSRLGASWDEKPHLYIPVEHLKIIKSY